MSFFGEPASFVSIDHKFIVVLPRTGSIVKMMPPGRRATGDRELNCGGGGVQTGGTTLKIHKGSNRDGQTNRGEGRASRTGQRSRQMGGGSRQVGEQRYK